MRMFGKQINDEEKKKLLLKAYESLKASYDRFMRPDGTKMAPARSCRDLAVAHPNFDSGDYWLDPNAGDIKDAILAYCDIPNRVTCVYPQPNATSEINHIGKEQELWLSDIEEGMKITYKADSNQIGFLQLLSVTATQNITYHCLDSIAYFDLNLKSYRKGLKLLGWNDAEIMPKGHKRLRYDILEDGCRAKNGKWKKTALTYSTDNPSRLPIIDIAMRDVGDKNQRFRIEIGPACFQ
uniref:Collagen alpha-1(II) chain n=2 Tax=Lygus hesperus TaxID=30085 RepID=A0A0A9WMQ7_LYGHE